MRVKCPQCGKERILQDHKPTKPCRKCGKKLTPGDRCLPDGVVVEPVVAIESEIVVEPETVETKNKKGKGKKGK